MLTLKDWYLQEFCEGVMIAHGNVWGHYRLADGDFIHTSRIEKIYLLEENVYVMETFSGSLYELYDNEMAEVEAQETREILAKIELLKDDSLADKLKRAREDFDKRREARECILNNAEEYVRTNLNNGELYLVQEGMKVLKALFRHEDEIRDIPKRVHVGMFQDSVLITDWQEGKVDFRFFPNARMEPYHWSDGLEKIHIHNVGHSDFFFKGTEEDILCKKDAVTAISKEVYRGEGLFSPDAVNGKCAFFPLKEVEEKDSEGRIILPLENLTM